MKFSYLVADGVINSLGEFFERQLSSFQGWFNLIIVVAIIMIGIALLTENGRRKIMPALPYIILGIVLLLAANNIAGSIQSTINEDFEAVGFITPFSKYI